MTRRKRQCNIWLAVLAVLVLSGCSAASETASPQPGHKAVSGDVSETAMIQAVATTGQVADLVRTVGGERVQVQALMGPGVDPHLYKATQSDIQKLETADVIFYNGLNLEGKLSDILAGFLFSCRKFSIDFQTTICSAATYDKITLRMIERALSFPAEEDTPNAKIVFRGA